MPGIIFREPRAVFGPAFGAPAAGTGRPRAGANEMRGGVGRLPAQGPREAVGVPAASADPVDADRAEPPPELRDPQRRFSTRPQAP